MNFFTVMALPLIACLLLVLITPALGQHVLARGVIFVDLALAQIAALGASVAFLLGADPHDPSTYLWSFGFTLLGAALFSFFWDRQSLGAAGGVHRHLVRTRDRGDAADAVERAARGGARERRPERRGARLGHVAVTSRSWRRSTRSSARSST